MNKSDANLSTNCTNYFDTAPKYGYLIGDSNASLDGLVYAVLGDSLTSGVGVQSYEESYGSASQEGGENYQCGFFRAQRQRKKIKPNKTKKRALSRFFDCAELFRL